MPAPSLTIARAAGRLSRTLGRGGGTSLPGRLLLRMRPDALAELGRELPHGITVISATNGKTTTARLVASCAREQGWDLVANSSGANLVSGVATALLEARGRHPEPEAGLFEVNEAALAEVARQLQPRVLVLMNLFRDQLDRYGELEHLADLWATMVAGLPPAATPVLNADDPAIAALGRRPPRRAHLRHRRSRGRAGRPAPRRRLHPLPQLRGAAALRPRHPRPPGPLALRRGCGMARPVPDVRATRVELRGAHGLAVEIETPAGPRGRARSPLPGCTTPTTRPRPPPRRSRWGSRTDAIARGLARSPAAFGRGERVTLEGRELVLLLAKNPTGANETVRTVLLDPEPPHLLIALNDRTADGHDISWIWDVDYEPLLARAASLTLTGDRAHDLALRMRYAGLPAERMTVIPDPEAALDQAVAVTPPGGTLYVLPTYTAMLGLRETLVRRGVAEAFWRER